MMRRQDYRSGMNHKYCSPKACQWGGKFQERSFFRNTSAECWQEGSLSSHRWARDFATLSGTEDDVDRGDEETTDETMKFRAVGPASVFPSSIYPRSWFKTFEVIQ